MLGKGNGRSGGVGAERIAVREALGFGLLAGRQVGGLGILDLSLVSLSLLWTDNAWSVTEHAARAAGCSAVLEHTAEARQ